MTSPIERAQLILAHDDQNPLDAVVPPIVQTSLFTFSSYDEMLATYRGDIQRPVYSRVQNHTVQAFEAKIAALELADDALAFASGMAAISASVLSNVNPGDRIVVVRNVYPDAFRLFGTFIKRMQMDVTYVDGTDHEAVRNALPGARLFYMESPTSWVMEALDVGALARMAKDHGVFTVIDNSWATPIFQNPLELGVDLVVHSASKYIGGHSDVVAGVVAGSKENIDRIRGEIYPYLGGRLAPMDAFLLLRGLRTLPQRVMAHQDSALELARRLQSHPAVTHVYHPGLSPLPQGLRGTTGLFSILLADGIDMRSFCDHLTLFKLGVSWGGHESLIVPGDVGLHQKSEPNSAKAFGQSAKSARLHVGLEGTEALWQDLSGALKAAEKA